MKGDAALLVSRGTEENEAFINGNYSEKWNKKPCIRIVLAQARVIEMFEYKQ